MQINGRNLQVLRVALERAQADVHTDRQHAPPADQSDLLEERIAYQNLLVRVRAAIDREAK